MKLPSVVRTVVRLALAVVVAAAAMPLHAHDADARRAVRAGIVGYKLMTRDGKSDDDASASTATGNGQPGQADPGQADPAAAPAPSAASAAGKKFDEHTVAGCAPGMICTVCIAGCGSSTIVIVHAERPITRKE